MKRRIVRERKGHSWRIGNRQGERVQLKRDSCGFFGFCEKQADTFWFHFVLTE